MSVKWFGKQITDKLIAATKKGIDKTMSESTIDAKQNHPGWKNISSTAEGSIRPVKFAEQIGNKIVGIWGSVDVDYMIWLELKHGSALRASADRNYPKLSGYILGYIKKDAFK